MMNIVRPSNQIKKSLSSSDAYDRAVATVENHIAKLPLVDHPSAWQNIPYLLQFYPSIIQLWQHRNYLPYVNPEMKRSGLTGYSKNTMHHWFDKKRMLSYKKIDPNEMGNFESIKSIAESFGYPCVVKPDEWERSSWVQIIENVNELKIRYTILSTKWNKYSSWYLIQEYCWYPQEYWLQFYRTTWWYTIQLAQKNIPYITWDWTSTLADRIENSHYKAKYKELFYNENKNHLSKIISHWSSYILTKKVTIAHWTTFSWIQLTQAQEKHMSWFLRKIFKQKPDLYVWRFDIKAESLESLLAWQFKIIECNGVWWIPLHVYDEQRTIVQKYEILRKHYDTVIQIAQENKKRYDAIHPMTFGSRWVFWYDCYTSIQTKESWFSQKTFPQLVMILYTILIWKLKYLLD